MSAKPSILIVEDSFIVAYHLQTTLESEGYRVLSTQDTGEGALQFLETNKPDLVLMDIMLNGKLDGIETAHQIKHVHHLPIIYITALTDKDTIHRAKVTEPHGYLTKPFEDREIFTVIEMALYKHLIESKLRQSEEMFFSTVRSISDAVLLMDKGFKITYLNPSAEQLTGWTLAQAQGHCVTDVLVLKNVDTGECPVNPIQCELRSGRHNAMLSDLILISRDGRETPIGEGSMSQVMDNKDMFSGLVIIFRDITQRIEHDRLLKSFEKERISAILEGQEKERSRIAKDLHDGLGQMLTAIKMNVNMTVEDPSRLHLLYKIIDDAIQESVRISENLLPSTLKDFDLPTCLKSLCSQIAATTTVHIRFECFGRISPIAQIVKINFYRIVQEAINNALKHAEADVVTVQLNEEDHWIHLTIEDDGKGMSTEQTSDGIHHGLGNMRDRAEIMGGKFSVESDKNRGTLIIVQAPVVDKTMNYVQV